MKNIKRIGAGILGAVMAGASILTPIALANHTLADYPAPFVDDGNTNFLIVVGADAKPADVVGAINIAVRLGGERTEEKTASVTGGQKTITNGVDLSLPGDLIYLKDSFSKDTLTDSDMPNVLADGTFTDDDGTNYPYTQVIDLGNTATFDYVKYDPDKDPELIIDLQNTDANNPLYTLEVTFSKTVNFTAAASKGQSITLFGKDYTIAPDTDSSKLVLYGSSDSVTLNKDEETTITVGGEDYTIKVVGFDTANDKVVLTVNGDTNDIKEGTSKKIAGLQVYAKTVTAWDQGNAGIAVLQLGSQKITLEDGQPVEVGEDNTEVDGTQVTLTSDPESLSTLKIAVYKPDSDHDYIAMGEDNAFKDPVFGTFKINFAGVSSELTAETRDKIELRASGDYKGYVTATDKNGNTKEVYFAYDSSGAINLQDDNQKTIYVVEGEDAAKNEYVFLAPGDAKYTHLVKVSRIKTDATNGYVEFKDVFSGDTYKTVEGEFNADNDDLNLIVDGKTYKVTLTDATADNEKVSVIYDDGKTVVYPAIELKNGEDLAFVDSLSGLSIANNTKLQLPTGTYTYINETVGSSKNVTVGSVTYTLTGDVTNAKLTGITVTGVTNPAVLILEEEDDSNTQNAVIIPTTDGTNHYISYSDPVFTGTNTGAIATENDKITHYVDYYGTFVVKDTSDSDHTAYTIYYPDEQMYALVGAGSEVTVGGGEGQVTYQQAVPIKDTIAYLDTDPAVEAAKGSKNFILVGGPAVNRLTAQVLGLSYPTYGAASTVPENAAMLKLVENPFGGGQVALVVAGWNAENTLAAANVLQKYDAYNLQGTAMKVEGTTSPTVSALEETTPAENQTAPAENQTTE